MRLSFFPKKRLQSNRVVWFFVCLFVGWRPTNKKLSNGFLAFDRRFRPNQVDGSFFTYTHFLPSETNIVLFFVPLKHSIELSTGINMLIDMCSGALVGRCFQRAILFGDIVKFDKNVKWLFANNS